MRKRRKKAVIEYDYEAAYNKALEDLEEDQVQRILQGSRKQCERVINANFGDRDIWATFTYTDADMPATMEEALKNMQNYIRRLNYQRKKRGLKNARYVYTTEGTQEGRGWRSTSRRRRRRSHKRSGHRRRD